MVPGCNFNVPVLQRHQSWTGQLQVAPAKISLQMCSHKEYCDWGVIKHQTPLMKNLLNGEKVKGSPLYWTIDKKEIGNKQK